MDLRGEILGLVAFYSGCQPEEIDSGDIFDSCGLVGDDADEFLEEFTKRYSVNLNGLFGYFHYAGDEPPGLLRHLRAVDLDGKIIPYIPISLDDLVYAVEIGALKYDYPNHVARRAFVGSPFALMVKFGLILLAVFLFAYALNYFDL